MDTAWRALSIPWAAILIVAAVAAHGQDWPQWRGPGRDGKVTQFAAPDAWPAALQQQWRVTVGAGDATPALVGDRVYVFARQGDDEVVLCLDAAKGAEVWRHTQAVPPVQGPASRHPGPRSSPAVAGGKVVVLGVSGVLTCLDAASGQEVWRKDEFPGVVPPFSTAMSPLIVNDLCIAHLGGEGNGAVIAHDLATGAEKWRWTGDGPAYASPVVLTVEGVRQIVDQTEKSLVGLAAADGKLLWQVATVPQTRFYNSATPIVDGATVIYTGQGAGTHAVTVAKQGDAFTARELWNNPQVGTGFNTPVLREGLLFGISDKGSLFCLDAKTGQTAWLDAATRRDSFGSVLDAGRVMLTMNPGAELVAFRPSAKACEEMGRLKLADTPVYAHPVPAGKRVFVKDQDALTLWTF